jgi:DNA invertase Pin-like site-specific DNA recombinase
MKRCVVYLRVSTPLQSISSSFARQLDCCTRYAIENGFYIAAIFSDASSGDGSMPSRSLAFVTATTLKCPILAENPDRWSRRDVGCDELSHAHVLFTAPEHEERHKRLAMKLREMIGMESLRASTNHEDIP